MGHHPHYSDEPVQVQEWLKKMDAAPKTKGHIKAIMHRLYEKAMLWEMVEWQRNPMKLVEIKGISKRKKKPSVLTVEQYYQIFELLPEPYRTIVVVAQCTGLRAEEVLALEWQDIDFENLSMKVVRAVVHGRVKMVKTEYSEDELPLDPDFAAILLAWKLRSEEDARKAQTKARLPGVTTTQHPSSRITFVLQDAAWWSVRSVAPQLASGVDRMRDAERQAVTAS